MKTIHGIVGSFLLAMLFIGGPATMTSCKKTVYVHDTTIVRDTTRDTTIVRDTVCDCVSGLVAYYNFKGGTLADSSGYGNNINFSNATLATDRNGVANNAFSFNGTSQYMTVPNSASINPGNITMYAIVKMNGFYQGLCRGTVIMQKGSPDNVQGFYTFKTHDWNNDCYAPFDASKQRFQGGFGNNIPQGIAPGALDTSVIKMNTWYKLAYTWDGKEARFYVNGVLTDKRSYSNISFTPNSQALQIGRTEHPLFPYWFNGVMDEIRIYNHALSECAIKELAKK